MPGLLDDRLGGEYLNTLTSCCLTNKEDRLSQTRPQDRTEVSDAQQNPRETILLSLSPCSHGLDLRLAALKGGRGGRSWGGCLSSWDRPRARWQAVSPCPPPPAERMSNNISSECENNNKTNPKSAFGYRPALAKLNNVSDENVPPRKISFVPQVRSDGCSNCCVSVKRISFELAHFTPCIRYPLTNRVSENPRLHSSGALRTSTTQEFPEWLPKNLGLLELTSDIGRWPQALSSWLLQGFQQEPWLTATARMSEIDHFRHSAGTRRAGERDWRL